MSGPGAGRNPAAWAALLLVVAVAGLLAWKLSRPEADRLPVLRVGTDFTLTTSDGHPFRLADQQGRIVLLSFGFTSCPDICPMTMARYRAVLVALGADAGALLPVMISVDPVRDLPEKLHAYVGYFDRRIVGLTGTREVLADIEHHFGAMVSVAGDDVSHGGYLYLIDGQGGVRRIYDQRASVAEIARAVRLLLHEAKGA